MKRFRKVWNDETNNFLISHKDTESRQEIYKAFMERFPDSEVTFVALTNQLSRLGLRPHRPHGSNRHRPLWSEQQKKGYVRIKIAEPNVWVSKAKWVYMETHPWEDFSERSNYIFLDGNNRNFSPDNIERVPLRVMGIFNRAGGTAETPELTRLRIAQAKLKVAMFDRGEKMGLVACAGSLGCRVFIEERNRKARIYNSSPERRKLLAEKAKAYREKLKVEQPEKYAELMRKQKERHKIWYERKKELKG